MTSVDGGLRLVMQELIAGHVTHMFEIAPHDLTLLGGEAGIALEFKPIIVAVVVDFR
jgi:hypothetical protein